MSDDQFVGVNDPTYGPIIVNESDVDEDEIFKALTAQMPEMAALTAWGRQTRGGGIFERDKYVTPVNIYDQFRVAHEAATTDDIVGGVMEMTESLAFQKVDMEALDEDEEDVWNQVAEQIDLDARIREMWGELFTYSQFYAAIWWGTKSFKIRGKTPAGVSRKRTFDNLTVPLGLSLLDPMKIIPVGSLLFNQERLAWVAEPGEADDIDATLAGRKTDPMVSQIIEGKYEPSAVERQALAQSMSGLNNGSTYMTPGTMNLYLLRQDTVFRHTLTRPQYKRFADVRMATVFELLDLKHQLRQMDRAYLIGGTNFIILVTKGSDKFPAKPAELDNLQTQVRTVARVPVIVGDHRLDIKIITPNNDKTLQPDRYNGLDARITARLFQMFMTGNFAAGAKGDDSIKLARVVGRALQSRRQMLRRALEANIVKPMFEKNPQLLADVSLRFHPKRIDLDFDPSWAQYILQLRDRGDLSRETVLDEADYDQDDEARKREKEKEKYDEIFSPVNVPVPGVVTNPSGNRGGDQPTEPTRNDPKARGTDGGGLRNKGGAAPGTGQGQPPRDPFKRSK